MSARSAGAVVVLVSGVWVAAVGADRDDIEGLARAERVGIPTFVCRVADHPDRAAWDVALADAVAAYEPALVVSAGFLKLVGPGFLSRFRGRYVKAPPITEFPNAEHLNELMIVAPITALLPAFPGIHGPRDALAYGVKVSGATLFVVDEGVDTGAIVAQVTVPVLDDDTVEVLTERIKQVERPQLVEVVGRMVRDGFTVTERKVTIP